MYGIYSIYILYAYIISYTIYSLPHIYMVLPQSSAARASFSPVQRSHVTSRISDDHVVSHSPYSSAKGCGLVGRKSQRLDDKRDLTVNHGDMIFELLHSPKNISAKTYWIDSREITTKCRMLFATCFDCSYSL